MKRNVLLFNRPTYAIKFDVHNEINETKIYWQIEFIINLA